jgi:hypothetical protein
MALHPMRGDSTIIGRHKSTLAQYSKMK